VQIYVEQFGAWWSFTLKQWQKFLIETFNGNHEWNLDESGKRLARPPYHILKFDRWEDDRGYARTSYYAKTKTKFRVYEMPCDRYDEKDYLYEAALADLKEMIDRD
jgi:hypothetical protein